MEIAMVVPEMVPFAKTGGLADVAGALPVALAGLGQKVSVFVPCYRGVVERWRPEPTGFAVSVPILEGDGVEIKTGEVLHTRLNDSLEVYLIQQEEYFNREYLYMTPDGDYPDNCARFTFFCRAVLDFLKARNQRPDLFHCHDWQSALIPIYLKTILKDDPLLGGVPVVFTIHNLGYQGLFWHWDMKLIGMPWEYFTVDYLEYWGKLSLLKGALVFSDFITTVGKGYAREIQTPEYGLGLDGVIRNRSGALFGIMNGIDYSIWNPETDPLIPARYSRKELSGKAECKAALQKELGLPVEAEVPVVGCISRLADQKGFDLLAEIMPQMMSADLQFVLLGTGDRKYQELFQDIAREYPRRAGVVIAYDDGLAHRIEAGADLFLMPSLYEPCGLNQMISLKYGTVPVVRATGGLDDTIISWDPATRQGNGFKFEPYSPEALWACLQEALAAFHRSQEWKALIQNGMKEDHSWKASAKEYLALYQRLTGKKNAVKKTARARRSATAAGEKKAVSPSRPKKTGRPKKSSPARGKE